jgi:hypothetical protein
LTIDELESLYEDATSKVIDIQTQLSNKNRLDADGNPVSHREYQDWRARAVGALRYRLRDQAKYKKLLKDARKRFNPDSPFDLSTADGLLHAAYVTLHRIACETQDFDEEETAVKNAIQHYLVSKTQVEVPK